MNKLMNFDFQNNDLMVVHTDDGEIWFRGFAVASILGYSNREKAVRMHVDAEDKAKLSEITDTPPHQIQKHSVFINESGLYSLIFRSKLKSAKAFCRWVTKEVLPSIRKTGKYCVPQESKPSPITERQAQMQEALMVDKIMDPKLKQAFLDRLINEVSGGCKAIEDGKPVWSRDIQTLAKDEFGRTIDFSLASKLGTFIKHRFVSKYDRVPSKYTKFVNGNTRKVNAYEHVRVRAGSHLMDPTVLLPTLGLYFSSL